MLNTPTPTVLDRFCRLLELLIALCLAVMVVMVFGNVVLRYVFNSGIAVSEELSRWLFVWMTFIGAIVALKEHGHLGTDMLVARLPRKGKLVCMVASQLLMLWVTWLLLKGSWAQVLINRDVEAPVTGAPMAVVYMAGVVFAVPAGLLLLAELLRTLTGRLRDDELVMVQESEDLAHAQAQMQAETKKDAPQ
ncbi:TRAP transporter small permease [Rubrivivax sp. RP6-9]|uniref:TRAP transporter small permease n=1 Tax=Rubrivivax sp. RP6-9 TaxID=3415750 RepID=UPI003CC5D217